jgi:hypothetical protein
MTIKIENILEYTDFRAPNKRVLMLEIHYVTEKDYYGTVRIEKQGATKESIAAAVKDAAALPESLIGEKLAK